MIASYNRHCLRAKAQGFKPLPIAKFAQLQEKLA